MSNKSRQRKKLPRSVEAQILTECRRRCCLCYHLDRKIKPAIQGQIAHIDHDRTNHDPTNLAYLCMDHHDTYDSRTSQSKGITQDELVFAKAETLKHLKNDNESGREVVSLTLIVGDKFSELSRDQREELIKSLLPPLVQASKTDIPSSADGKTRYTVELASEEAERICNAFNARQLPAEVLDVQLTRPVVSNLGFADAYKSERNGVTKQQAIEVIHSHDQVMLFLGKKLVTTAPVSCGIFTKRYSKGGGKHTTIVITSHDDNDEVRIFAAVKAYHDIVGNLDNANPLQCLEAFLKVFGVPISIPQIITGLYVLGEQVKLPVYLQGKEEVAEYLKRFIQSPRNENLGIVASLSYNFPPQVVIHIMYCFDRERYLALIRNKPT